MLGLDLLATARNQPKASSVNADLALVSALSDAGYFYYTVLPAVSCVNQGYGVY